MCRMVHRVPVTSLSTGISEKAPIWGQTDLDSKPGPTTFSLGKFGQVIPLPRVWGFHLFHGDSNTYFYGFCENETE